MISRRRFLHHAGRTPIGAGLVAALHPDPLHLLDTLTASRGQTPDEAARDEVLWRDIQQGFTLDRTIINLNNGGVCPSPRVVHEALKRYLDLSNQAPVYHMWQLLEPNIESVRRQLAAHVGCNAESLAITRNASEALQIAQLGIELSPGDEVLTTNQDYPRMLDTWEQRVRRDGIRLTKISFPVPAPGLDDLVARFERAITPRTRVLHFCHITNLTGQIFPVREICRLARARNILTIVDGAHAYAHFPFALADLECDYYGTSLHKWLLAPIGTGFLYVRRELIPTLWPLTPAPAAMIDNIRKFEEIGTHPAAMHNAIAEALAFHEAIGGERKAARLRHLRARWSDALRDDARVRLYTSADPAHACGIGTVGIDGVDPARLQTWLWERRRILVTTIRHAEYEGIRVTPNVYTTLDEIDTFIDAMRLVIRSGLPAS